MLNYFVQVQAKNYNLYIKLTYHKRAKYPEETANDPTENRTNFLHCVYDNHSQSVLARMEIADMCFSHLAVD